MVLAGFCAALTVCLGATYEVGPDKEYATPSDVPWEDIVGGDTVLIHHREEPYKDKWVISQAATAENPIIVRGVMSTNGALPVIDGDGAVTRNQLWFWGGDRAVIKIGGANIPPGNYPEHITIENLDVKSGRAPYTFRDDEGTLRGYKDLASSIYVESGGDITIRNCIIRDSGNGLLTSHATSNVVVEGCYIHSNGGSPGIHNNYTESQGILFQFNRFGPPRPESLSGTLALKDRSAGTIVRYNWIEGSDIQISLVESVYPEIYQRQDYSNAYVYGNVLIDDGGGIAYVCRYGGDFKDFRYYRKGVLHFYNNTIIYPANPGGTDYLLRFDSDDETCDFRNNIVFYGSPAGVKPAILDEHGVVNMRHNWFNHSYTNSYTDPHAEVYDLGGNMIGVEPFFVDYLNKDFHLLSNSPCINTGTNLEEFVLPDHDVLLEYLKHQASTSRWDDGVYDMGAYEAHIVTTNQGFDADGDGMNDEWEIEHFNSATNAGANSDHDGDGFRDWEEFVAGTNPTNASSFLGIWRVNMTDRERLVLEWQSSAQKQYVVTRATNVAGPYEKTSIDTLPGTPPFNAYTDTVDDASAVYYRIELDD